MRDLPVDIKADFILNNKGDSNQEAKSNTSRLAKVAQTLTKRTQASKSVAKSQDTKAEGSREGEDRPASQNSNKRGRPRSRTFTLSKNSSPTKKQKSEGRPFSTRSSKSIDIPKSSSTRSLVLETSSRDPSTSGRNRKQTHEILPSEFVVYLRQFSKPQEVEVGKLHKLRILLRNETVAWVDSFIEQNGMTELVGLLQRIMEIEWR